MVAKIEGKKMKIDYVNGKVEISFPYNPTWVDLIKNSTENRKWNPDRKVWVVGLSDIDLLLIPALKKANIPYLFSENYQKAFLKPKEQIKDFGLKYPLYPYQLEGANALYYNNNFGLFHDTGLGKTIMSIATINKLYLDSDFGNLKVLILCPSSLIQQWADEIQKFSDLKYQIINGSKEKRQKQWIDGTTTKATITLANYEKIRVDEAPLKIDWDIIILDESTRIKNFNTKTTQRVKMLKGRRKWALTATAIENSVKDLFSLFDFLDDSIFNSWWKFKEQFLITELQSFGDRDFEVIIGEKNIDVLEQKIKPYYIRRLKQEVLPELPNYIEEKVYIELSASEKHHYNYIKSIIEEKIMNIKDGDSDSFIGELQLLRVLCNGEVCLKHSNTKNLDIVSKQNDMSESSSKIEEIIILIKQLLQNNQDKIIVFSDFTEPLFILAKRLEKEGVGHNLLYGGSDKTEELKEFKTNKESRILLCQMKTGSYGLNLTEANNIIFMNRPFNPAVEYQAISRAHRNGQTKTVFIYYLITKNTIEEKIITMLNEKKEISNKIIKENYKLLL